MEDNERTPETPETPETEKQITQETTIKSLSDSLEAAEKNVSDLTAERDSLLEELNTLKEKGEKLEAELAETKKLNFQLGRTIGNADYKSEAQLTEETYQQALAMVR